MNLSDYVRLFHEGLTPVARSRLSPNWVRLHEDQVFYYRSPSHAYRYVYSISFRFESHDDEHQFALFYPHNYTMLERFLDRWLLEMKRKAKIRQRQQQMKMQIMNQHKFRMVNQNPYTVRSTASSIIMQSSCDSKTKTPRTLELECNHCSQLSIQSCNLQGVMIKEQHDSQRSHSSTDGYRSITPTNLRATTSTRPSTPMTTATTIPLRSSKKSSTNKTKYHRSNDIKGQNKQYKLANSCKTGDHDDSNRLSIQSMGTTILNKRIYHVSVGDRGRQGSVLNVVVLCRAAGNLDSACSFVCQGLIDYVMSDSLLAKLARRYINFEFFPMLDPDSIWVGNTRTDLLGQTSSSQRVMRNNARLYEGLLSIHDYINELILGIEWNHMNDTNDDLAKLTTTKHHTNSVIILDMHVNLSLIGSRVIGTCYNEPFRMEKHLSFPRFLSQFSQHFYLENCKFLPADDPIPSGLFNFKDISVDNSTMARIDQYRFELSPFASFRRSLAERAYNELTPSKFFALAKAIAFSLLEMAKPKQTSFDSTHLDQLLHAFHQGPGDIDDLNLNLGEFE